MDTKRGTLPVLVLGAMGLWMVACKGSGGAMDPDPAADGGTDGGPSANVCSPADSFVVNNVDAVGTCFVTCVDSPTPDPCFQSCAEGVGISASCAQCASTVASCSKEACGSECQTAMSSGCYDCFIASGCVQDVVDCGIIFESDDSVCGDSVCSEDETCGNCSQDCCETAAAGDIVITEAYLGTAGWIEVFNPSPDESFDLRGCRITDLDTLTLPLNAEEDMGAIIGANQYGLIAASEHVGGQTVNITPTMGQALDLSTIFGPVLAIQCGPTNVTIDSIPAGHTNFPVRQDGSMQLSAIASIDASANDDPANWCGAASAIAPSYDIALQGTPRSGNNACPAARTPALGEIVITEFMLDPETTGGGIAHQWVEVRGVDPTAVLNFQGCVLKHTGSSFAITVSEPLLIRPKQPRVFATRNDLGFDVAAVNTDQATPFSTSSDTLSLLCDSTTIDEVTYSSWSAITTGYSLELSQDSIDLTIGDLHTTNDSQSAWCQSAGGSYSVMGNDNGLNHASPNADNFVCP